MKNEEAAFTLRTHQALLKKLDFIADYYGRSRNSQINWMIRKEIVKFEQEIGPIEINPEK